LAICHWRLIDFPLACQRGQGKRQEENGKTDKGADAPGIGKLCGGSRGLRGKWTGTSGQKHNTAKYVNF